MEIEDKELKLMEAACILTDLKEKSGARIRELEIKLDEAGEVISFSKRRIEELEAESDTAIRERDEARFDLESYKTRALNAESVLDTALRERDGWKRECDRQAARISSAQAVVEAARKAADRHDDSELDAALQSHDSGRTNGD